MPWWDDDGDQESTLVESHTAGGLSHPRGDGAQRAYTRRLVATLAAADLWAWWTATNPRPNLVVADLESITTQVVGALLAVGCKPEAWVIETGNAGLLDAAGYKMAFRAAPDMVFVKDGML